jgi:ABC-type Fe3+-citrate transport system substrate-binding protein
MKIKHRIPPEAYFVSDPITPEYQAQVDRTMAKAAGREREAQRRLAAAEARLAKAQRIKPAPQRTHAVLVAQELVEIRRQELLTIQREMSGTPSSAQHRSKKQRHKPVTRMTTL